MAIDFEAEGLLRGTRGKGREERRKLLEELAAEGVSLEELRRAVEEDRLALLPVERVLEATGRRYTAAELAERSGVELEFLARQWQALGLPVPDPDEAEFTEEDLAAADRVRALRESGLPDKGIIEGARVIGMAIAQIAAASRGLVGESLLRPGDSEREAALRYAAAARELTPLLGPMLEYVLGRHLREIVRQDVLGRAELAEGRLPGSQEVTACFADLVGFTKLGERLHPEELGAVTGRFAELVGEVIRPPVRLVKMIGDAAMVVSADNGAVLDAGLELVEAAEAEGEGLLRLRAGLARGLALARAGDWYGSPVNIASRITAIARPGSVLCADGVRETAVDGYRWSFAGQRRLRGIAAPVRLYRCRREPAISDPLNG